MRHLDLFSGIGGFALAAQRVWGADHKIVAFCDNDKFCRQVLKKHWPKTKIYEDIKEIKKIGATDLITGGFPCQPFSQAGKRKGTADDRHLWPEMFRIIRLAKPEWIIAENVRGLITWNDGLVFEQVCTDLENENYKVQPLIIPACAQNAPHRRDRVWIIANCDKRTGRSGIITKPDEKTQLEYGTNNPGGRERNASNTESQRSRGCSNKERRIQWQKLEQKKQKRDQTRDKSQRCIGKLNIANTNCDRLQKQRAGEQTNRNRQFNEIIANPEGRKSREQKTGDRRASFERRSWNKNWFKIATKFCGVDDGLPAELDGFKLSKAQHRVQRIKALGNAIVPQVAEQIFKSIKRYGNK